MPPTKPIITPLHPGIAALRAGCDRIHDGFGPAAIRRERNSMIRTAMRAFCGELRDMEAQDVCRRYDGLAWSLPLDIDQAIARIKSLLVIERSWLERKLRGDLWSPKPSRRKIAILSEALLMLQLARRYGHQRAVVAAVERIVTPAWARQAAAE